VTRPRFGDVAALTRWVYRDRLVELRRHMDLDEDGIGILEPGDAERSGEEIVAADMRRDEQEAVEAAERGDPRKLADLIERWRVYADSGAEPNPVVISVATWKLVVEFLRGKRKRKRGRPRMSAEERTRLTATHDAALEFPAVKLVLKREYRGDESARNIHERALDVVARRHNMNPSTLANHLNRARLNVDLIRERRERRRGR
jgi:hypothetical protein